jgi:hypothetical protein
MFLGSRSPRNITTYIVYVYDFDHVSQENIIGGYLLVIVTVTDISCMRCVALMPVPGHYCDRSDCFNLAKVTRKRLPRTPRASLRRRFPDDAEGGRLQPRPVRHAGDPGEASCLRPRAMPDRFSSGLVVGKQGG